MSVQFVIYIAMEEELKLLDPMSNYGEVNVSVDIRLSLIWHKVF